MDNVIKTSADALEDDVLPKMRAANAAGTQDEKLPSAMTQAVSKKSAAQWAYERVVLYLKKFEETLDAEHEAAMDFAGGDAGVLRIEGMECFDPYSLRSTARTQRAPRCSWYSTSPSLM